MLFLSFLISCQEGAKEELPGGDDPSILDDMLTNEDGTLNIEYSDSASRLYHKASNNAENDSIRPYYLMKSADIQRFIPGEALLAIKKYYELLDKYPNHILVPAAYFMVGLTFDENLNDKERSAKVYADFVEKYPDHSLAGQAANLLIMANDTLSDLDQVHKWKQQEENKNKQQ